MREILFRGKRISDGTWVEGFYYKAKCYRTDEELSDYISVPHREEKGRPSDVSMVWHETVGQYTGLTDKNGKRVFEGDIIKTHYANVVKSDFVELVVFNNGKYCGMAKLEGGGRIFAPLADGVPHVKQDKSIYMDCMEVIGNIHDNPELLEGA